MHLCVEGVSPRLPGDPKIRVSKMSRTPLASARNRLGERRAWIKPHDSGEVIGFEAGLLTNGAEVHPLLLGFKVCHVNSTDGSFNFGDRFDVA